MYESTFWLHEQRNEDSFEKLIQWIDTRVQIMDEAKEKYGERRYNRGHHTDSRSRKCVVTKCTSDHPLWVCPEFKKLPFAQRKELISKIGRCLRCLTAVRTVPGIVTVESTDVRVRSTAATYMTRSGQVQSKLPMKKKRHYGYKRR